MATAATPEAKHSAARERRERRGKGMALVISFSSSREKECVTQSQRGKPLSSSRSFSFFPFASSLSFLSFFFLLFTKRGAKTLLGRRGCFFSSSHLGDKFKSIRGPCKKMMKKKKRGRGGALWSKDVFFFFFLLLHRVNSLPSRLPFLESGGGRDRSEAYCHAHKGGGKAIVYLKKRK